MKKIQQIISEKPWIAYVIFAATVIVVFLIGLFGASIVERRSEAVQRFQIVKPIADWEPRNEVWGENFPREFESYYKTSDTTFASQYGGSANRDMLAQDPNLVVLWAGYAFSKDYNQGRGHFWAIKDIRKTLRTGTPQPATCWTCKSTDVPRLMKEMGVANFYKKGWNDLGEQVVNVIGCQDCHDPKTMNLRITRPALIEAFKNQGKEISQASHQEMRSLVCAQCHVEYYFKGKTEKYLTLPWQNGFTVEAMEKYYDEVEHVDFVHTLSKTPILKAQHPDFEVAQFGIHAERGVACADCHMPYKSEGGVKFTDHHIQSPLNNVSRSCQVCHRESEATLVKNVNDRQDKISEMQLTAEGSIVKAHLEAKIAWDRGATESQMKQALSLIRQAQWRWDYVAASHGGSFHAPVECARVLGASIQKAAEARIELTKVLTKLGIETPVVLPDISTKEKAQKFLGLDIPKLKNEKKVFLSTVIPEWDKKAGERQARMK
ncbi:MAG: ammonia-forming cytochrome c nitrite reductase [Ignavibacteria bacterium]|nr:ammonia-forming cytochrome c nitrite reductase [Ignavibacteria bacterium]